MWYHTTMKTAIAFFFFCFSLVAKSEPATSQFLKHSFETGLVHLQQRMSVNLDLETSLLLQESKAMPLQTQLTLILDKIGLSDERKQTVFITLSKAKGVGAYQFQKDSSVVCLIHVPLQYKMDVAPTAFASTQQYHTFLVAHELYHCAHANRTTSEPVEEALADAYAAYSMVDTHPDIWKRIAAFRRNRPHDIMHRSDELLIGWEPRPLDAHVWTQVFQELEERMCRTLPQSCPEPLN